MFIDPKFLQDIWRPPQNAVAIHYGDKLVLVGTDQPHPVPSGGELQVNLSWRVTKRLDADYSTGVLLVDEWGMAVWAHSDHQHPGNLPTNRWLPESPYREAHWLKVPAGTPPGHYLVKVVAYPYGQPYAGLDILDTAKPGVHGKTYDAAIVEVVRPFKTASVDDLAPSEPKVQSLGGGLTLLGSDSLPDRIGIGKSFLLTLYWQAEHKLEANQRVRLEFVNSAGTVVTSSEVLPVQGYDTGQWLAGDTWKGVQQIFVPAHLHGRYTLTIIGSNETRVSLGELQVIVPERSFASPNIAQQQRVTYGDLAVLLGYDTWSLAKPGDILPVTLYWQPQRETRRSWKVFVHLLDTTGNIVSSHDAEPAQWERPTTSWVAGEYIVDMHTISLPADIVPGNYRIVVGLYDEATGERLETDRDSDAVELYRTVSVE